MPPHAQTDRRTIYRGSEPQRKPLIWLAFGLMGVCLIGLFTRGPEPSILAALALWPVAVLAYFLFVVWGQQRIRRVDLDAGDLVIRAGFGKERRVALAGLEEWALEDIALYSTGVSYDSTQQVQIETGLEVKGPALTAREKASGERIELVVEDAEIHIEGLSSFRPGRHRRIGKTREAQGQGGCRFQIHEWRALIQNGRARQWAIVASRSRSSCRAT